MVETLFGYHSLERAAIGSPLYCLSETGRIRWQFQPGRKITAVGGEEFSPTYFIADYMVLPGTGNRGPLIAVTSNHVTSYPLQLAILDAAGKLVGEYWHSGHLLYLTAADIDGDSRVDLLAGGVNSGFGRAELVVFDPENVAGASAQLEGDTSRLKGFGRGTEKLIVRFPKSCLAKFSPYNRVCQINASPHGIEVFVAEGFNDSDPYVVYQFDRGMTLRNVTLSADFVARHKEMEFAHTLDHPLDEDVEAKRLAQHLVVK